mgnify:CR=1 FL=1
MKALPTPYGQDYINAADLPRRSLPPLQSAPEGRAYLERIQEEEWRRGPYGSRLSETLLDAANYFESRGDLEQASSLLSRAVHLIRVNDGLYSDLQLGQLERLMKMRQDQGQLDAVGELQARLFRLQRKAHAEDSPPWRAALLRYTDWQRRNWLLTAEQDSADVLSDAWSALDKLMPDEEQPALSDEGLAMLVYAQLDLLYSIGVSDFGLDRETELMLGRGFARDQSQGDMGRQQLQYLQKIAYGRGRKLLDELIAQLEVSAADAEIAQAHLRLGDWHLWYSRVERAQDSYRKAWQLMADDPAGREALHDPVALPSCGELLLADLQPVPSEPPVKVVAIFTVDKRGRPKKIETSAEGEGNEGLAYRLTRLLRNARFRPRLENGVMTAQQGVQRSYYVEF